MHFAFLSLISTGQHRRRRSHCFALSTLTFDLLLIPHSQFAIQRRNHLSRAPARSDALIYYDSISYGINRTQWAQASIDRYVQGFPETTFLKPTPLPLHRSLAVSLCRLRRTYRATDTEVKIKCTITRASQTFPLYPIAASVNCNTWSSRTWGESTNRSSSVRMISVKRVNGRPCLRLKDSARDVHKTAEGF